MAGTQPRQQTDGAPRRGDQGAEAGRPAGLYKYNGNLLHLSALTWLEFAACGMDCRGHKVFVCMPRLRICRRKVTCWRIEKVVELQKEKVCYSTYTTDTFHVAWGDFKADFVAGYVLCSRKPILPSSFNARLWERTEASSVQFNPNGFTVVWMA